jgi:hypothetical protein
MAYIILMLLGAIESLKKVVYIQFYIKGVTNVNNYISKEKSNSIIITTRSKEKLLQAIFSLYAYSYCYNTYVYYIIIIQDLCGTLIK